MTRKLDIETNLDRALARQVKVPQLDHSFDAAVWARIEAEEHRATNPVMVRAAVPSPARWLFIINIVGVGVAVFLVLYFGLRSFSEVSVNIPLPEVSTAAAEQIFKIAAQAITALSVILGLLLTPIGRRLRAELT